MFLDYIGSVMIDVQLEQDGSGEDKMFDILLFEPEESNTVSMASAAVKYTHHLRWSTCLVGRRFSEAGVDLA